MNNQHYPMQTLEQTRLSLAQVGRDFMHNRITEKEWQEIRVRLHTRLDELNAKKRFEEKEAGEA